MLEPSSVKKSHSVKHLGIVPQTGNVHSNLLVDRVLLKELSTPGKMYKRAHPNSLLEEKQSMLKKHSIIRVRRTLRLVVESPVAKYIETGVLIKPVFNSRHSQCVKNRI